MNRIKLFWAALTVALLTSPMVQAAADTDISAAVTDLTATWGVIKTPMIAIGLFLLGYGLFKRLRRA